jgi:hypothetical protein
MKTISINTGAREAAFRTSVVRREHPGRGCARLRLSWRDCRGEKILQGLLVLAAVAGIGYGCSCLVDLVQSCALFGARMAQSIP